MVNTASSYWFPTQVAKRFHHWAWSGNRFYDIPKMTANGEANAYAKPVATITDAGSQSIGEACALIRLTLMDPQQDQLTLSLSAFDLVTLPPQGSYQPVRHDCRCYMPQLWRVYVRLWYRAQSTRTLQVYTILMAAMVCIGPFVPQLSNQTTSPIF